MFAAVREVKSLVQFKRRRICEIHVHLFIRSFLGTEKTEPTESKRMAKTT